MGLSRPDGVDVLATANHYRLDVITAAGVLALAYALAAALQLAYRYGIGRLRSAGHPCHATARCARLVPEAGDRAEQRRPGRDEGAVGLLFGQAVHWAAERGAESGRHR